jgi:hypothetical protein
VDGTQLAAIFDKCDVIVWNYPSGKILFKELDEPMDRIEWNPFRPNVFALFATLNIVNCFFISILFPPVRDTSCDLPSSPTFCHV